MKKILITVLVFLSFQFVRAEKYALIIAIGDYQRSTGWSTISSANDVILIEQALLVREFSQNNIEILLNKDATYQGIQDALDSLLRRIKPGDIVVIHYSGHGQQIFDDDIDEEIDDKDEALVPYDAQAQYSDTYAGGNHFRDDELGNYITRFRNALQDEGQLLLLLDSCHSGSSTRGTKARGSKKVFAPVDWKPKKNGEESGSDMTEDSKEKLIENAAPFVLISGASANELNYEYKGTGSLSYAFNKVMLNLGKEQYSYNQLFSKIQIEMNDISPNQKPTIEGNKNIGLFKNEIIEQEPYFEVKNISSEDVIEIQAGKLQGLFKNTTVNVLPATTTKFTEEAVLARGKITLAKFNEAVIELDTPLTDSNAKKYWVFVDKKTHGEKELNVCFDTTLENEGIKKGVTEYLETEGLGKVVNDFAEADVVLMQKGNIVTLNLPTGLAATDNDKSTRGSTSLEDVNAKLFNFAHGQYLKNLEIKNDDYAFDFKLLPFQYDMRTQKSGDLLPEDQFKDKNGILQVKADEDWVYLQVTNNGKKPIYFSIVEINTKGEIASFFPSDGCEVKSDDDRYLKPGDSKIFKECLYSFSSPYEVLTLKGFATPYPINLQATVTTRGEGKRSVTNPLDNFISETYKTRGNKSKKSSETLDGYSTKYLYEIIKK